MVQENSSNDLEIDHHNKLSECMLIFLNKMKDYGTAISNKHTSDGYFPILFNLFLIYPFLKDQIEYLS